MGLTCSQQRISTQLPGEGVPMMLKKRSPTNKAESTAVTEMGPYNLAVTKSGLLRAPFVPHPSAKVYGRMGGLEVRLARSKGDMRRAQRLRYHVFYNEMAAIPDVMAAFSRRDEDHYDPVCDHLMVVDTEEAFNARRPWPRKPRVVGTYRVLRQEIADLYDGFYTQGEYDIAPLIAAKSPYYKFMEMGRSCVLKSYRKRRTLELLWQGLWNYIREHGVDVVVGCASFSGTDPRQHAMALSFLHHNALAPPAWRVRAHKRLHVDMNMMPVADIDHRVALHALPPLIKGYLKLGAYVGDGAVVDHQFGTTDILMILPVEDINERYLAHFSGPDQFGQSSAIPDLTRLN
jgi:putative hemolysin